MTKEVEALLPDVEIEHGFAIDEMRTRTERNPIFNDGKSLWFLAWDESPVVYVHDGKSAARYRFPKGTFLSQHQAWTSSGDGKAYVGGHGPVVFFLECDRVSSSTNDLVPKADSAGSAPDPYSLAAADGMLFATFAGSGNRTEIFRLQDSRWTRLDTPAFDNLMWLKAFDGKLIAVERDDTSRVLDFGGKCVATFSRKKFNLAFGKSCFLTYDNDIEVRNPQGALLHTSGTADALKEACGEWMDIRCLCHKGDDVFLLLAGKRHVASAADKKLPGRLFEFDAPRSELRPHPLSERLKVPQDSLQMEPDPSGNLWFRRSAARINYFTVVDMNGKKSTIKNK
jgi:hypothetical protein